MPSLNLCFLTVHEQGPSVYNRYSKLYCSFLGILNTEVLAQIQDQKIILRFHRQMDTCTLVRATKHNLSKHNGPYSNNYSFGYINVIKQSNLNIQLYKYKKSIILMCLSQSVGKVSNALLNFILQKSLGKMSSKGEKRGQIH